LVFKRDKDDAFLPRADARFQDDRPFYASSLDIWHKPSPIYLRHVQRPDALEYHFFSLLHSLGVRSKSRRCTELVNRTQNRTGMVRFTPARLAQRAMMEEIPRDRMPAQVVLSFEPNSSDQIHHLSIRCRTLDNPSCVLILSAELRELIRSHSRSTQIAFRSLRSSNSNHIESTVYILTTRSVNRPKRAVIGI